MFTLKVSIIFIFFAKKVNQNFDSIEIFKIFKVSKINLIYILNISLRIN